MKPAAGVLSLGVANGLALLSAVGAAALYARWLEPAQFAQWAWAWALARAGLLLLDGGLKTALVRRNAWPDAVTRRRLQRLSAAVAIGLTVAVVLVAWLLSAEGRLAPGPATLLAAYVAGYLLPYPALFEALARLERAQHFAPVGQAEGASVALEFALPALLMAAGLPWWAAFALAVGLARTLRTVWIVRAARDLPIEAAAGDGVPTRGLLAEGAGVQAVAGLSMLRDQMHLWLLGPWFGAAWAGAYTLALTACALVTQVSVATAARVTLPSLRATAVADQWPAVLARTRWLAIGTLPPLVLLPAWVAQADALWWGGRWQDALLLLPWLALRMVPGVATTTLGAWLLVAQGPWRAARAHAAWTGIEATLAVALLVAAGPVGLAMALGCSAWAGVVLFLKAAAPDEALVPRLRALVTVLLWRPSLWSGLALALWAHADASVLPWVTLAMPLAWLAEPGLRRGLARRLSARGVVHGSA